MGFFHVGIHTPLVLNGSEIAPGIPGILYAGYQCMFAIITPPLMTGAFADRFRFKPYLAFVMAWIVLVYAPVCHWVWGGGWMLKMGIVDWAGGIVVHITAGFSALASLLFVGRRITQEEAASSGSPLEENPEEPHNVPFVALGTAMLWFGWFGFNGGSSYMSNGAGILATLNSQLAAAAAAVGWLLIEVFVDGLKPGIVGFCVGAIAGLATVTPAAGYIQPSAAVFLGFFCSGVCWGCVKLAKKWNKYGFEDALDVWGVHGMGGFTGTVLLGLLADGAECADADKATRNCANPGIITRSASQFMMQLGAAVFVALYSFGFSFGILKGIERFMAIVPEPREQLRLDAIEHGEQAYTLYTPEEGLKTILPGMSVHLAGHSMSLESTSAPSSTVAPGPMHVKLYDDSEVQDALTPSEDSYSVVE